MYCFKIFISKNMWTDEEMIEDVGECMRGISSLVGEGGLHIWGALTLFY